MTNPKILGALAATTIIAGLFAAAANPAEARRGRGYDDSHHHSYHHSYTERNYYRRQGAKNNCIVIGDDLYCQTSRNLSKRERHRESSRCVRFDGGTYCHH